MDSIPKITKIPATVPMFRQADFSPDLKRRVAAYARVSTDSDEQETSFDAQVDYYTKYISSKPDWTLAGVYTDEGISAVNTKRREGFKRMIADALDGKIDLIVTKSVSRFARNTVDSLVAIRELKDAGVECYFEKEGIYTFDGKGELLITIMSSLAQEESRSISENITWGQRKRFADGKVNMPYKRFLGYKKGKDGQPEVVEDEARVVRLIYRLFMDGRTPAAIAAELERMSIPSPGGCKNWCKNTIDSILKNEKYKGDALLQKKFTVDFLQKKTKRNEGEVPQYYVRESHPAIIEPAEWELVQAEFERRRLLGRGYSGKDALSGKLFCGDCGGLYGRKVWHSTDRYRRVIWQCNRKFEKECSTPTLDADTIKKLFIKAYNTLMRGSAQVISDCELMRKSLADFAELGCEIASLQREAEEIAALARAAVKENAATQQRDSYDRLSRRYDEIQARLKELQTERERRSRKDKVISQFIQTLQTTPVFLDAWDDTIWAAMVERAVVSRDGSITFIFYNGADIRVDGE